MTSLLDINILPYPILEHSNYDTQNFNRLAVTGITYIFAL